MRRDRLAESLAEQAARWEATTCCEGRGWTYLLEGAGMVKIGKTDGKLAKRIVDIQRMSPVRLRLLAAARGACNEGMLHGEHSKARSHGEWFDLGRAAGILRTVRVAEVARLCFWCASSRPHGKDLAPIAARVLAGRPLRVEECARLHYSMTRPAWFENGRPISGYLRTAKRCYEAQPDTAELCRLVAADDDSRPWPESGRCAHRRSPGWAGEALVLVARVRQLLDMSVGCSECWAVQYRRDLDASIGIAG